MLIVFGTRPEAIKMAPLVMELKKHIEYETRVCITAQHREMLDQVLDFFEITPDYDLNLMRPGQDLFSLTSDIIVDLKSVFDDFQPDYVFVHGDTTTSMAAALSAFYYGAKVCHIEAGLRTFNKRAPFPEEINRQLTGRIADLHFAPTEQALQNLKNEGISEDRIAHTGNTVIDALILAQAKLKLYSNDEIEGLKRLIDEKKRIVLVTGHRRENFGQGFINICEALRELASLEDVQVIYPVHLNPNVQKPVTEILSGVQNVNLIKPLGYPAFTWLMKKAYIIITDSGGVQEEAPSLGKPVLVMRDTTERPEAVEAGTVVLVGTDREKIVESGLKLLNDPDLYSRMSEAHNPYGDGHACERIVKFLMEY